LTHLPSGIVVACQSERNQGVNREKATKILLAKLLQMEEEKAKKELKEIKAAERRASPSGRGDRISASWGNQIRSYVLHPYKLVKDLRTDVESSNPDAVLDGDLDQFIEAEIKI
jgi:peptide chain release factor 2